MPSRAGSHMSAPVTVMTYPVRSDAEIARARLEADGIRAAVRADDEGGLNPGFYHEYGVRVVVAPEDVDDALQSLGIERLEVPRPIAEAIYHHAVTSFPEEACGLLAADEDGTLTFAVCLTNTDRSPHRFTIDPSEHHGALRFAESHGWHIAGVFHSHPRAEARPSLADLGGGADPDWLQFILGPVSDRRAELRAYRYEGDRADEVSVTIAP